MSPNSTITMNTSITTSARVTRSVSLLSSPPSAQPQPRFKNVPSSPLASLNGSSPLPSVGELIRKSIHSPTRIRSFSDLAELSDGIEKGFKTAKEILDTELGRIKHIDLADGNSTRKLTQVKKTTIKKTKEVKKIVKVAKDGKIKAKVTKLNTVAKAKAKDKVIPKSITTLDIYEIPLSSSPPSPHDHSIPDVPNEGRPQSPPTLTDETILPKRIWTPVKDSPIINLSLDSPEIVKPIFSNIMEGFKFNSNTAGDNVSTNLQRDEPLKKRRCLELVDIPSVAASMNASRGQSLASSDEQSTKGKKSLKAGIVKVVKTPKPKKRQTITEIAMAPYLPEDKSLEVNSSIPEILEPSNTETVSDVKKSTRKPRKSTGSQKATKKRKQLSPERIILSPVSAQKSLQKQIFQFGTSSQLLTFEIPEDGLLSLVKEDVQGEITKSGSLAMNGNAEMLDMTTDKIVSEEHYEQAALETAELPDKADDEFWKTSKLEIYGMDSDREKIRGKLWNVGSRGLDGELVKLQVIDMIDDQEREILDLVNDEEIETLPQPAIAETTTSSITIPSNVTAMATPTISLPDKPNQLPTPPHMVMEDINQDLRYPPSIATPRIAQQIRPPSPPMCMIAPLPVQVSVPPPKPASKAVVSKATKGSKNKIKELEEYVDADKPNFDTYTLIQLQAQVDKYGFKPIKTRKAMIILLNKCWDNILKRARLERGEEVAVENAGDVPLTLENIDDITSADSDEPLINTVAKRKATAGVLDGNTDLAVPKLPKRTITKRNVIHPLDKSVETLASPKNKSKEAKPLLAVAVEIVSPVKGKRTKKKAIDLVGLAEDEATLKSKSKANKKSCATSTTTSIEDIIDTPELHRRITTAIKRQPPSEGLSNPSIFQRILMYEPIVIEELAQWLVDEGSVWTTTSVGNADMNVTMDDDDGDGDDEDLLMDDNVTKDDVLDMTDDAMMTMKKGKGKANAKTNVAGKKPSVVVGIDAKKVKVVQEWCEKGSVVWVRRESVGGGSRKRY